jgi:SAM-dependent methyltransferase
MAAAVRLACPDCAGELAADLRCNSCRGAVGQVIDGIPCFTDPDYYWGEISKSDMQLVNARAPVIGWEDALRERIQDESLLDYFCSPRRADFQHVWDLPRNAMILDVGAGLGAITSALAQGFSDVVAVEGILERARFIRTRTEQMNLKGVSVLCADFLRLPLAPGQFHAIVLNGVLEWSALKSHGDPRQVQLRFLRQIRDLLRPNGSVCVGIENRFGWAAIRGGIDHSGLRYTSLMPRRIADWVCRARGFGFRSSSNVGYRAYTYSLKGYHKLLTEAGFTRIRTYQPWDGYNMPTTLVPLESREAVLWFLSHGVGSSFGPLKRAVLMAAARVGLYPHLSSDFVFLADKS